MSYVQLQLSKETKVALSWDCLRYVLILELNLFERSVAAGAGAHVVFCPSSAAFFPSGGKSGAIYSRFFFDSSFGHHNHHTSTTTTTTIRTTNHHSHRHTHSTTTSTTTTVMIDRDLDVFSRGRYFSNHELFSQRFFTSRSVTL